MYCRKSGARLRRKSWNFSNRRKGRQRRIHLVPPRQQSLFSSLPSVRKATTSAGDGPRLFAKRKADAGLPDYRGGYVSLLFTWLRRLTLTQAGPSRRGPRASWALAPGTPGEGRSNVVAAPVTVSLRRRRPRLQLLLIVADRSQCGFAQLKLVAHLLEARSESFNLLLLLGYCRSLFLYRAVLFEELVQ